MRLLAGRLQHSEAQRPRCETRGNGNVLRWRLGKDMEHTCFINRALDCNSGRFGTSKGKERRYEKCGYIYIYIYVCPVTHRGSVLGNSDVIVNVNGAHGLRRVAGWSKNRRCCHI